MAKKKKGIKKEIALPLFIVGIMIMSVFGYMWGSGTGSLRYNGFRFYVIEGKGYILNSGDSRIEFSHFPSDLEWLKIPSGATEMFNSPMSYSTSSLNSSYLSDIAEVQFRIAELLSQHNSAYMQQAFNSENEYSLPVITCNDAKPNLPVLLVEESEETSFALEGSCLKLRFRNRNELLMAYERFAYSILGVMP